MHVSVTENLSLGRWFKSCEDALYMWSNDVSDVQFITFNVYVYEL